MEKLAQVAREQAADAEDKWVMSSRVEFSTYST